MSESQQDIGFQRDISLSPAQRERSWRALPFPGGYRVSGFSGGLWATVGNYSPNSGASFGLLYYSLDGVRWQRVRVGSGPRGRFLRVPICIGDRCVLDEVKGGITRLYHYRDGRWCPSDLEVSSTYRLAAVGKNFFFLDESCTRERRAAGYLSVDGASWQALKIPVEPEVCLFDVAYGQGSYVLGGLLLDATQRVVAYHSSNAERWSASEIPECDLVEEEPGRQRSACSLFRVHFAGDRFFGQNLSSDDGKDWALDSVIAWSVQGDTLVGRGTTWDARLRDQRTLPEPVFYENHLERASNQPSHSPLEWIRRDYDWALEGNVELPPDELSYPWADGLNCTNRRCLVHEDVLYLIPRDGDLEKP